MRSTESDAEPDSANPKADRDSWGTNGFAVTTAHVKADARADALANIGSDSSPDSEPDTHADAYADTGPDANTDRAHVSYPRGNHVR